MRKFDYLIILQGFYGQGWEDLTAADDTTEGRREVKADLRAYRDNERGSYRIIRRRELRQV
jgi:hypothetical protein